MSLRLSGLNPLSYMGVEPTQPPQLVAYKIDPTTTDNNFNLGTLWLNTESENVFMLVNLDAGVALWMQLNGGGGGSTIFDGNTGMATPLAGHLNIVGTGDVSTAASGNTVEISVSSFVAITFDTDSGSATPDMNVITMAGGTNINTSGASSTVTINLDNDIIVDSVATTPSTAHMLLSGTTLETAGSDANINMTIQSKGSSSVTIDTTELIVDAEAGITINNQLAGTPNVDSRILNEGLTTTNATPASFTGINVGEGELFSLKALVQGYVRTTLANVIGAEVYAMAYRAPAGNVTLLGTPVINYNTTIAAIAVDVTVDTGAQTLLVTVTGQAATTYDWTITYLSSGHM